MHRAALLDLGEAVSVIVCPVLLLSAGELLLPPAAKHDKILPAIGQHANQLPAVALRTECKCDQFQTAMQVSTKAKMWLSK